MSSAQDIDVSVSTRTPDNECRACGFVTTAVAGPAPPTPGDFSICGRCQTVSVFTDDLRFRAPTAREWKELARNPVLAPLTDLVAQAWEKALQENAG